MPQFTVSLDTFGNISVESGVIIDITGSFPLIHRFKNSTSFAIQADTMGASRWGPKFCGGSGKNIFVNPATTNPDGLTGFFSPTADWSWGPRNQNAYNWSMDPDTFTISLKDQDNNVLAESAAGAFNPYGPLACSSGLYNGVQGSYYYEIDLGTDTGTVNLTYDAYSIPDRFIVTYDGVDVIDTGLVGVSGDQYELDGTLVSVTVVGPGAGTASFTKSNALPRTAILKVIAPYQGTEWECNLGCPGGGTPPFNPITSSDLIKIPFTAPSTALGTATWGSSLTLDAYYEGNKAKGIVNLDTLEILPARRTTVEFQSECSTIGNSSDYLTEWHESTFQSWATDASTSSIVFRTFIDGSADIYDGTDIIATKAIGSVLDSSGGYSSTEYGAVTYNDNVSFLTSVTMHRNSPMSDMVVYITLNIIGSAIDSIDGPFLDFEIPTFSTGKKHIPLAMVHPDLTIDQLSEGSIIWK